MAPPAILSLICLTLCLFLEPANADLKEIYDGGFNSSWAPILLRIGNGGAGQSGLLKVLADGFIQSGVWNGTAPFRIGWVLSVNTFTIKYLQSGDADVGVTYNPSAEQIAINQGIASMDRYYLFRDHFLITGLLSNPANISNSSDVATIFSDLFHGADQGNSTPPVRFLSRYDKSATNIKESRLWLGIGQVPWSTPYSTRYHQYIGFSIQALMAAIQLQEYTLTDRGMYLSLPTNVSSQAIIYKASSDNEADPLPNPAHLLIGKKAQNATLAKQFAKRATP